MNSDTKQYRQKILNLLEQMMLAEKREDDSKLAVSPKGLTPEGWAMANDMSVALRLAPAAETSAEHEQLNISSLATCVVISMQENVNTMKKLFPGGPGELLSIMQHLNKAVAGRGFGTILQRASNVVSILEKRL
jgi:hypothetical protein